MRIPRGGRLAAVLLLLAAMVARADQIKLADGRTVDGKIVRETEVEVKIEVLGGAVLTIPRKEIVGIERGKSPAEVMEDRLEALRPEEPAPYEKAGLDCLEQKPLLETGRRCLLIAGFLAPERYADLQVRVGDSFTQARDRPFAYHFYVRALLARPEHAAARARVDAYPADQRTVLEAEDPLQPPSKGVVDLTPSLRMQAERRLRRTGERVFDEDLLAGRIVYHKGAWVTPMEKRKADGTPETAPAPDWADLFAKAAPGPASEAEFAAWIDAARAGTRDRAAIRRTAFASAAGAGGGPFWSALAGRAGFRLTVPLGPGARAVLRAGEAEAFHAPAGVAFGEGAELTVVFRLVRVEARIQREKDREQVRYDATIEPVGFELRDRPGGKTTAAWR